MYTCTSIWERELGISESSIVTKFEIDWKAVKSPAQDMHRIEWMLHRKLSGYHRVGRIGDSWPLFEHVYAREQTSEKVEPCSIWSLKTRRNMTELLTSTSFCRDRRPTTQDPVTTRPPGRTGRGAGEERRSTRDATWITIALPEIPFYPSEKRTTARRRRRYLPGSLAATWREISIHSGSRMISQRLTRVQSPPIPAELWTVNSPTKQGFDSLLKLSSRCRSYLVVYVCLFTSYHHPLKKKRDFSIT